jgi:hypothetical protein
VNERDEEACFVKNLLCKILRAVDYGLPEHLLSSETPPYNEAMLRRHCLGS